MTIYNTIELLIPVFEKCRRAVYNSPWMCQERRLAHLEIALYVEPRSAVLEKLRGAINHSHVF
jgi:hypothetical protein